MLFNDNSIENSSIVYLFPFTKRYITIYHILLIFLVCVFTSLPFIKTTISVKSKGITRPASERTEVKPVTSGIIDIIFFKEGSLVKQGDTILRIKDNVSQSKRVVNNFEIRQRREFIHDLQLLTTNSLSNELVDKLQSPVYKEQANKFIHLSVNEAATLKQATKELEMNESLAKDKVISPKEIFDIRIKYQKADASFKAFQREQLINWQQDMDRYRLELSQYADQLNQVNTDASYCIVKAPVTGTIQGIQTFYEGGAIQTGETVCSISPETSIVGECYITPQDIGLVKKGQTIIYQIDAFNYNYFGVLTGKIISIDNDFTLSNNQPMFKVRCSFDDQQLKLKNGFSGKLGKGLSFQARFVVAERSLWQLLFDKLDDWLNPSAPVKS